MRKQGFQILPWKNEGRMLPNQVSIHFQTMYGCSIGVVPRSSFRVSSGLVVVSGCAWSGSGAWSSEWFSGSVADSRMALARTLLRLSLPAPGARMYARALLMAWPVSGSRRRCAWGDGHTLVLKNPRPSSLIPSFLNYEDLLLWLRCWGWLMILMCLSKTGFWNWEATNYLVALQSHLDWDRC